MSPPELNSRARIEGLKQIARYCGWDSRTTVKKYLREGGLPLHTIGSKIKPRYYAWPDELDAWMQAQDEGRSSILAPSSKSDCPHSSKLQLPSKPEALHSGWSRALTRWKLLVALSAIVLVTAIGVIALRTDSTEDGSSNSKQSADGSISVSRDRPWLWSDHELDPERMVLATITSKGKLAAVGLLTSARSHVATPELVFFEPNTGAPMQPARLLFEADKLFRSYSNQYTGRLQAIDFDTDGVHELLATFRHTPNWPAYSVLYEPLRNRVSMLYASTGHHDFVGSLDLDRDGSPDLLLFEGQNNLMGWRSGLAATWLKPRLHELGLSAGGAGSPNYDFGPAASGGLAWYALGQPIGCRAGGRCLSIDEQARTITIIAGNDTGKVIDFDGLDMSQASDLPREQRLAARNSAYELARDANRYAERGAFALCVAPIQQAIELVVAAGFPNLLDWLRHLEVRMLALAGRTSEAREHAAAIRSDNLGKYRHAFEIAAAFHVAGNFEEAATWYQRGLMSDSTESTKSRPAWELLRGLALTRVDLGHFDQALSDIASASRQIGIGQYEVALRAYVLWRAGINQSDEVARQLASGGPDYIRYWGLELLQANGLILATDLLEMVRQEQGSNSEARPMLRSLEAELLARTGESGKARLVALEALAAAQRESRFNPVVRSHLELIDVRSQRLENSQFR